MKIKVMTFNLRCACDDDGINHWRYRTGLVKDAITDEAPDLIGFQEVTRGMLEDLKALIGDEYVVLGAGRDKDYGGEGVNIAYRKDKFDLLHFETFWLSDTPTVPGSRYTMLDQSGCPRVTVLSGLTIKGAGRVIYFCNTHLDHMGRSARVEGAKLILKKMQALCTHNDRIIITGDLNAYPDSETVKTFVNKDLGISDITENISATFHKWGQKLSENIKIDYIFTNSKKSHEESYAVTKYEKDGVYCSDHNPVCGFVEI